MLWTSPGLTISRDNNMEFDPDILILTRSDGTVVARFSAYGIDLDRIRDTAKEDLQESEKE